MKKITIVMPYLNEETEPIETIKSIYETADSNLIDIIAIDDNSDKQTDLSQFKDAKVVKNEKRLGVDGSRQLGVEMSETPYLFVIDAHMRFRNDNWLDKMLESVENEPETIWCTICLGLGYGTMNINEHKGEYCGADMLFIDKNADPSRPAREVLEPKWSNARKNDLTYDIPCVLGANYVFSREWFDKIHGLKGLQMWGTSEPFLSIKSWMAGGKCKIRTDVKIGHKFRSNAPYATGISHLVYNKIFLCKTILPDDLSNKLIDNLPKDTNYRIAMKEIENNYEEIMSEREYYESIFNYSIYDYCSKFDISLP